MKAQKAIQGREVWFLTGSQGLYGDDTLRQVAEQPRRIADALGDSGIPVNIIWKPVLTDAGAIRRVCLDANADDTCIGLIAWMHTFSPAKMWIAGLDALRKPLLHLHTQADAALPWASIDMDFMNLNQAAHGDREFGYIQSRLSVARKTVAGHVSDPSVAARIASWARAAAGRSELQSLKLARFGDNMRDVAVTEGDKVEAQLRFGVSVNTYGVNDLVAAVDASVTELVKEYEDTYRLAPELRADGDRHDSLRYAARIELGLRGFLTDGGFHAFTTLPPPQRPQRSVHRARLLQTRRPAPATPHRPRPAPATLQRGRCTASDRSRPAAPGRHDHHHRRRPPHPRLQDAAALHPLDHRQRLQPPHPTGRPRSRRHHRPHPHPGPETKRPTGLAGTAATTTRPHPAPPRSPQPAPPPTPTGFHPTASQPQSGRATTLRPPAFRAWKRPPSHV
ncbi:hypothetical protein OHA89_07495 [Streptomyces sp. NBC_01546]